jgi:hypothetical protein
MASPETLLAALDAVSTRHWLTVGRLLAQLEADSLVAPDGRPWADHLQDRLAQLGVARSPGHVRKIRTAYRFLQRGQATESGGHKVLLTSADLAQRIAALDPSREAEVLQLCLAGTSPADLQELYAKVRGEKNHRLSPRQLAWDRRRKVGLTSDARMLREDRLDASIRSDTARWWGVPDGRLMTVPTTHLRPYLKDMQTIVVVTHPTLGRRLGAWQVHRVATGGPDEMQRILETTQFRASFVDRYWLVLDSAGTARRLAGDAWALLGELDVRNVGVMRADLSDSDDAEEIGLGTGEPALDRRNLLLNLLLDRAAGR